MASNPAQPYAYDAVSSQWTADGPEVFQPNYPEVVPQELDLQEQYPQEHHPQEQYPQEQYPQEQYQQDQYQQDQYQQQYSQQYLQQMKSSPTPMYTPMLELPENAHYSVGYSTPPPQLWHSQEPGMDQSVTDAYPMGGRPEKRMIFGCTFIVFALSIAVGVLAASVIGLSAGLGVEVDRLRKAEEKANTLSSSLAVLEAKPTPTSTPANFNAVTKNCSTQAEKVSGTTYNPQAVRKPPTFTIYCNKDATAPPIMAIFAYDFDSCMDACASYSNYVSANVKTLNLTSNATSSSSSGNETEVEPIWAKCYGVSFLPIWWDRDKAQQDDAPGNCYLKHGPQNQTSLDPQSNLEVHAGIIES